MRKRQWSFPRQQGRSAVERMASPRDRKAQVGDTRFDRRTRPRRSDRKIRRVRHPVTGGFAPPTLCPEPPAGVWKVAAALDAPLWRASRTRRSKCRDWAGVSNRVGPPATGGGHSAPFAAELISAAAGLPAVDPPAASGPHDMDDSDEGSRSHRVLLRVGERSIR